MSHSHEPILLRLGESIASIEQALHTFRHDPLKALEIILTTFAEDIRAARADVQAIAAAFSTDIATAVANQKAADDQANAQNVQDLADARTAFAELQGDIATAKTAAGIVPPAADPQPDPNAGQ